MSELSLTAVMQITNVLLYVFFLGSNVYTVAFPEGYAAGGKITYLTPAPWAYLIWYDSHSRLASSC